MKSYLILLAILFSCRPGLVEMPTNETLASKLQSQFPSVISLVSLKNTQPDCALPPCDAIIADTKTDLQTVADSLCQAVYGCVDCCLDDKLVSATLYVQPKSPPCPVALEVPAE